ncbi:MAG TPA: D-alanyl-D-alanine endopeptidase [Burkholderiales bacterium]|nr:D-alanyl-D-alanine endopeptidase [Burkholderiales bacterium]
MRGRLLAFAAGCVLAANVIAAQQAAIEHGLGRAAPAKVASLKLKSNTALVLDQEGQRVLYAKNDDSVVPIASITKLMTALVVLDSGEPLDEKIKIQREDRDGLKGTRSRLSVGMSISRDDLLRLALMSSENRAAAALARAHPGGTSAFVDAMNDKAAELGMWHSRFVDGTGLSSGNVASAQDLARLVNAAHRHPLIREYTTDSEYTVRLANGHRMRFLNSNRMVRSSAWDIGLSKTGYIREAGRCLVLQAQIATTPVIIVLLDSWGQLTRIGDANRIKKWMEGRSAHQTAEYTQ